MRVAVIDETGLVTNVILVEEIPEDQAAIWIPAEDAGQLGDVWNGSEFMEPGEPIPARAKLMSMIDDAVEARTNRATRFALAYEQREAAAIAYKNGGYTGDPTTWITRFADNVGKTYKDATDLILSQATALRSALADLENLRMDKYLILSQASDQDAKAKYESILAEIGAVVIP